MSFLPAIWLTEKVKLSYLLFSYLLKLSPVLKLRGVDGGGWATGIPEVIGSNKAVTKKTYYFRLWSDI